MTESGATGPHDEDERISSGLGLFLLSWTLAFAGFLRLLPLPPSYHLLSVLWSILSTPCCSQQLKDVDGSIEVSISLFPVIVDAFLVKTVVEKYTSNATFIFLIDRLSAHCAAVTPDCFAVFMAVQDAKSSECRVEVSDCLLHRWVHMP